MSAEEMKRGIRTAYADGAYTGVGQDARLAEFDRMIAEVVREAEARALEEAADALNRPSEGAGYEVWASGAGDWLRARAAEIRGGAAPAPVRPVCDREAVAREVYRELYPGSIDTHDSKRTPESDLAEADRAYLTWDNGKEGFAPGVICRRVADRVIAHLEAAPVLPSSGVDEDALAEVIASVTDLWDDPLDEVHDIPQITRAVAEWLKEQGNAARE